MNVPSTNQHSGQLSGFHYCFYCSSLITWQGRQGISAAQLWNSSFCSLPYHAVYLPAFLPYALCCSIWFNWAPAKYTGVYILCISFIKVSLLEPTVSSAFNLLKKHSNCNTGTKSNKHLTSCFTCKWRHSFVFTVFFNPHKPSPCLVTLPPLFLLFCRSFSVLLILLHGSCMATVAECLAKHRVLKAGSVRVLALEPCSVCVVLVRKEFAHMVCPLVSKDLSSATSSRRPWEQGQSVLHCCKGSSTSNNPPLSLFLSVSFHPSDSWLDFELRVSVQIPD